MSPDKLKGTLLVLLCVALWGLIPVVAKIGQNSLDNHQFLFWSSLVSFLTLTSSAFVKDHWRSLAAVKAKTFVYVFCLGLLGTYVYYLFLYLGYAKATGMEVLVVQYTWPFLIVLLSVVLLGESLGPRKIIAVIAGFTGVLIVLTRGEVRQIHFDSVQVILLVAAGSTCFALFSVLSKNVRIEPLTVNSIYFLSALIASGLSMFYFSGFAVPSDIRTLAAILLNGILVNGFSYVFWVTALRKTEASYLAPYTYLTPVISAVYLVMMFDEPFYPAYAVGLLLVVAGGLVNAFSRVP